MNVCIIDSHGCVDTIKDHYIIIPNNMTIYFAVEDGACPADTGQRNYNFTRHFNMQNHPYINETYISGNRPTFQEFDEISPPRARVYAGNIIQDMIFQKEDRLSYFVAIGAFKNHVLILSENTQGSRYTVEETQIDNYIRLSTIINKLLQKNLGQIHIYINACRTKCRKYLSKHIKFIKKDSDELIELNRLLEEELDTS